MPRQRSDRSTKYRDLLAERVEAERQARGWSYERVAAELAKIGVIIASTGLWKITHATPPRNVTVDELLGFADVFDCQSPLDLFRPFDPIDFAHRNLKRAQREYKAIYNQEKV